MQKLNTKVKTNLHTSNIENNETIDQENTFSHQYNLKTYEILQKHKYICYLFPCYRRPADCSHTNSLDTDQDQQNVDGLLISRTNSLDPDLDLSCLARRQ